MLPLPVSYYCLLYWLKSFSACLDGTFQIGDTAHNVTNFAAFGSVMCCDHAPPRESHTRIPTINTICDIYALLRQRGDVVEGTRTPPLRHIHASAVSVCGRLRETNEARRSSTSWLELRRIACEPAQEPDKHRHSGQS